MTRDPDTVYVVFDSKCIQVDVFPSEDAAIDEQLRQEDMYLDEPHHVTVYDRRNEAERAHLEEAARILSELYDKMVGMRPDIDTRLSEWLASERKRRGATT